MHWIRKGTNTKHHTWSHVNYLDSVETPKGNMNNPAALSAPALKKHTAKG